MSSSASHPSGPHCRHAPKYGKSGPHCWGWEDSTQFAQQLVSAVTAPPLLGNVVCSLNGLLVIAMRKLSPTRNYCLGPLGTGMMCMSLRISSSSSLVTSDGGIRIVWCLLLLYDKMRCCCCLPTPMSLASGGESDVPACGPPASFSVHLASSAVTPAGSVHKSRGDNVVRMWVQLKR